MKNFKVYYCNSFLESCYYVRCLMPMREGGWDGDRTSLRITRKNPETQAKAVLDADIVVFHRPNDSRCLEIAQKLREQGKKIVFENDDTYKHLDGVKLQEILGKLDGMIDTFIEKADMVTCTTEQLAEEYRKLNKNVIVLPNCVDPTDWPKPLRHDDEVVRIGIIGSVGLNNDCDGFRDELEALSKRSDVRLVLFGLPVRNDETLKAQSYYEDEYKYWEGLNVEWQPFVPMEDYTKTLNSLKLDFMVIPRKDDYFNHCKSNLKFLEASMLEIPVIAQGWDDGKSPYQVDLEDGKYMKIIIDKKDWMPAIDELIANKENRREMGRKAREYVLSKYQIKDNIHKWIQAYESLL